MARFNSGTIKDLEPVNSNTYSNSENVKIDNKKIGLSKKYYLVETYETL